MKHSYKTRGVCAVKIDFELDDQNKVHNIVFHGGCPGNHLAIAALAEGKDASEVVELLSGLPCGFKPTSCGDQLAKGLEEALSK